MTAEHTNETGVYWGDFWKGIKKARLSHAPVEPPPEKPPDWFTKLLLGRITLDDRRKIRRRRMVFSDKTQLSFEQIMTPNKARILTLFTTPDPPNNPYGGWQSQKDVMFTVYGDPHVLRSFKNLFLSAVWRMELTLYVFEHKREYMEQIGLSEPPQPVTLLVPVEDSLLTALVRFRKSCIEQVYLSTAEEIAHICSSRRVYNGFEARMQEYYPGWHRDILYHDELPASQA